MGVYIRDMEMPLNCYHCWLGHNCPKYESLLWHEINKERKADCPFVPVPAHGRLIDADALYEDCALDNGYEVAATTTRVNEYMQLKIDVAPTVIPAEDGKT